MPNREPVILQQDKVTLRHVGPKSAIWPAPPAGVSTFALLNQAAMIARPLPVSDVPASQDFVSGSWTGRLGDAGEAQLVFPNATSSDGEPWRDRFDPTGHLQFVEVRLNGFLEVVGVIDQVTTDQQGVTVHAYDAFWLLKKAYVRDWVVTQAPRDVIERGTALWTPFIADNFPASSTIVGTTLTTPTNTWGAAGGSGATLSVGASGGINCTVPGNTGTNHAATVESDLVVPLATTAVWRATATVHNVKLQPEGAAAPQFISLFVGNCYDDLGNNDEYELWLRASTAVLVINDAAVSDTETTVPPATSYALALESDGEWVSAFVNGQLVGCLRRQHPASTGYFAGVQLDDGGQSGAASMTIDNCFLAYAAPFLQQGSDKGDYVLPGDASTYPTGGLHARYFNDLDLSASFSRLSQIMAPPRTQTYGASSPAEYANQQDATINGQANPTPGATTSNWSVRWFGAIYLKLSAGNFAFQLNWPGNIPQPVAARLWIGRTKFGDQIIDAWTYSQSAGAANSNSVNLQALLTGTNSDGTTSAKDGWYPIVIEYSVDSTALGAPTLYFTLVPVTYTDPGGTSIPSGSGATLVPATSLSPLGCVDQRYQGISHFDLIQQTAQAFDHQIAVKPQPLESGLFPGVLAPRIREGQDTDIVLKPDLTPRDDAEGLLNYSSTLDSSDFASSLQGNGAGLQTGTQGQLQELVYDPATLQASLFDAQQWQDFSDAAFPSLLQALLNSQLGLQLEPWQLLSADPNGRPRKAFTWPLTGATASMRWRPGDGVRINAPLINVIDTAPRQMLVITRNIAPHGITSTQGTFANRPKNPARALKRQLYTATRLQRNYQRQIVTLNGQFVNSAVAAGAGNVSGSFSGIIAPTGLQIVRARLYVAFIDASAAVSWTVVWWSGAAWTDISSQIGGPFSSSGSVSQGPFIIDVTALAKSSSDNRLLFDIMNLGPVAIGDAEFQLQVDVLR